MNGTMPEKKKAKRYPSRDRVKYIPVAVEQWDRLEELGKPDERSVSYMVRRAIREMLERIERGETD